MEKHTLYIIFLNAVALTLKGFHTPYFPYLLIATFATFAIYSLRFKTRELIPGTAVIAVLVAITTLPFSPYHNEQEKVSWIKPLGDSKYIVITSSHRYHVVKEQPEIGDVVLSDGKLLKGNSITNFFPRLRYKIYRKLEENCDYPISALTGATTLGVRNELPYSIKCYFLFSGIYHYLAISGLHVAIVIGAVGSILKLLKFSKPYTKAALALLPFIPLTGMPPSLIRAYLFSLLVALGVESFRRVTPLYLLGVVMLLTTLFDKFNLSAALSFSAVFGILIAISGKEGKITKSFKVSFYPMLFTLPIILFKFGTFTPFSFISSILSGAVFTPFLLVSFLNEITLFKLDVLNSLNELLGTQFIKLSQVLYPVSHKFTIHSEISLPLAAGSLLTAFILILLERKRASILPLLLLLTWAALNQTKVFNRTIEVKGRTLNSFYFISSEGQRFENCTIYSSYVFPATEKFMKHNKLIDKRIIIQPSKRRER